MSQNAMSGIDLSSGPPGGTDLGGPPGGTDLGGPPGGTNLSSGPPGGTDLVGLQVEYECEMWQSSLHCIVRWRQFQ